MAEIVAMGKQQADAVSIGRSRLPSRKSNSAGAMNKKNVRLASLEATQLQDRPSNVASRSIGAKNVRHVFRDEQRKKARLQDPAFISQIPIKRTEEES